MPTDAIRVRGLSHGFGGAAGRRVLDGLDLDVAAGSFTMLVGPSGCGKTTLLTLIGGLRSVQTGTVRTLGTDLAGASEATRIALRRRIGFVFQGHELHSSLTALGNVRMGLEVHGPAALGDWQAVCDRMLAAVGLGDRGDSRPAGLSNGQNQRVAIARALVSRPRLVLADEPTAALDREAGRNAVGLLRTLAAEAGCTVLMVTHDSRIFDFADRIVALEDGRIAEDRSAVSGRPPRTKGEEHE
jgi:putative ABC transport system ATP-binding protein